MTGKAIPAGVSGVKSRNFVRLFRWKQFKLLAPALAASLVIAVTLMFSLKGPALEDEIIASYRRSLAMSRSSNTFSAASSQQRPGLIDKLHFIPPIPDLAASGFTYKGARLDQIAQHTTAVLTYTQEGSTINLFIWPSEAEPAGTVSRQGYNIIRWTRSGLKYCAISTLNAGELSRFQELFASKLPA
jgi:anti-sigma factor RsiW